MNVKIYYIPGSHPCQAVFKAAELKGIEYKRVVVLPPMHRLQMTMMFGSRTVPAVKISDADTGTENTGTEKIQTSRKILRAFESMVPEPALFPADPAQRERVVAAETWGDGNFQDVGRRLIWAHLSRSPQSMASFSVGHPVPLPDFMVKPASGIVTKIQAKLNKASDEAVKADVIELGDMLDQVDRYIADGVIGGEQPNAADLQILSSLWLWRSMDDIRPAIDARPCGEATQRLFGEPAGHVPGGVLPADWLKPLNAATTTAPV